MEAGLKRVFSRIIDDLAQRQDLVKKGFEESSFLTRAFARGKGITVDVGDVDEKPGVPIFSEPVDLPSQSLPTVINLTSIPAVPSSTILLTPSGSPSSPVSISASPSDQAQDPVSLSSPILSATPTPDPSGLPKALPSNTSTPIAPNPSAPGLAVASLPASSVPVSSGAASITSGSHTNWFLENKPRSIALLTLSSLVTLVLVFTLATWCIRRSRRDRFQDLTSDFSQEELVGPADVEKGDTLNNLASPYPNGASASGSSRGGTRRGSAATDRTLVNSREMYERTGYPALPVFVPQRHIEDIISPIREPEPAAHRLSSVPQLPNPFEVPRFPPGLTPPNSSRSTGRSPNSARKPPPPLLQVNIPIYSGLGSAAYRSSLSLALSPMPLPSPMNPANPPLMDSPSPQSGSSPSQTSLLNLHRASMTPRNSIYARSHSQKLDHTLPEMPTSIAPFLPDEFGFASESSSALPHEDEDVKTATRRLKVVNQ